MQFERGYNILGFLLAKYHQVIDMMVHLLKMLHLQPIILLIWLAQVFKAGR